MTLWTPDGEIPIDRQREQSATPQQPQPAQSGPQGPPGAPGTAGLGGPEGVDLDQLSPEERAKLDEAMAEMAQVEQQITNTPAWQIVANHIIGLYQLAAIKLRSQPPQIDDAKLAIDAMAAAYQAGGDRLGEATDELGQALNMIQMAFVQISEQDSA